MVSSARNPEPSWVTAMQWATEKIPTWKLHAFGCWLCLLWSPKEPVGTHPLSPSSFLLTPTIALGHQHLYGSSLHTCLAPSFHGTSWGTGPKMVFVIDKGICIHESHKTAADKESIAIGHNLEHLPWIFPRDHQRWSRWKSPSPILPLEEVWLHVLQAAAWRSGT